jgi:DNA helicase-2/ATP-dependent DNA helicase PcrA
MSKADKQAFDGLNSAQQEAVEATEGPILVVAGAGTGKTRVIVERIQRLIVRGIEQEAILALTFTEKAAVEMIDRINASKNGLTLDTTIATFNRCGNDLLKTYGSEWGLGRLRLLGDTGQLVFLREHFDEFELDYFAPVSNPDGQLELLARYVSDLKQQLITPDRYAAYLSKLPVSDEAERLDKQKHQELAYFFTTYLTLCRREQVIDYDDQLYLTIDLLKNRPNILKQLRERYRFILVDEFQDTNPMQSEFVDLLAGKTKNIMVVGDDDQSIYGWRGATLANILDFKQRYPAAQETTLIENYRSTQAILDCAYRLIQHNNPYRLEVMNQLDKRLRGQTDGPAPTLQHFSTYEAELTWLAEDIQRRLGSGQPPGSIAVLARRNEEGVQKIHETLELHGVPHMVAGLNNNIYAQNVVRQLIETLKAVADPHDDLALFHTLSGPLFKLDASQLADMSSNARRHHLSLSEAIQASHDASIKTALEQVVNWRQLAAEQSVGSVAYAIVTDSGWKQQLYAQAKQGVAAVASEIQALSKFFTTLKEFERVTGVASAQNYILNLPVLQAAGNQFEDPTLDIADDQVNVLSVHRSKGLEWQTVYLVDCSEGSFPLHSRGHSLSVPAELKANPSAADEHMAEERRLMYVAVTRARQELILSYADRHGSGVQRKPSRFLNELLGHEPAVAALDEAAQTSLELFAGRSAPQATVGLPAKMQQDGRLTLNVSQIETWLRCPQDFYYKYVLSMPLPPAPQLEYGSLIHSVIEQIHRGRHNGTVPSLEQLLADVVSNLPQTGYATKRTRERAHEQASKTVKAVYERFLNDALPIETEWPFDLVLPDLPLTIRGKIDAVYQLDKGVEIRDFKTGTSVRTAEQAKSRTSGSQQLTLYALAWQQLRGELPARLSLDFVETGQSYAVKKQAKSLDTLQDKLAIMVKDLQQGNYPAGRDHKRCLHPVTVN